jgi:hypothetical protein
MRERSARASAVALRVVWFGEAEVGAALDVGPFALAM